jgi:hypothetical protein
MLPTSSVRQLLAGRTFHIVVLIIAGFRAPLGACGGAASGGNGAAGSGVGTGGTGGHGAGGAQQCSSTDEYAIVDVTLSDGMQYHQCSDEAWALEGVVRNVAGNTIVIDSCHPNANCAPMENVITLSGTDLFVSIPDGTFVQVSLYSRSPQGFVGCIMLHAIVRNLPDWAGTPNPTSDGTFLWLAYHDGSDLVYTLPDDPYQTERELACKGTSYESPEVYTWRFSFPDAPGAEVTAPQGQTVTWSVPEGEHAGHYRVRNVKAVYWYHPEYNYWIARK